jgi:hypothetical protein
LGVNEELASLGPPKGARLSTFFEPQLSRFQRKLGEIDLQATFNTLHHPNNDCQYCQDCDPECDPSRLSCHHCDSLSG